MIKRFLALFLLLPLASFAADCCTDVQAIPGRTIPWYPGVRGGISNYPICTIATDYGADPTGVNDSWLALQAARAACTNGGAFYFPAGTYKLTNNFFFNAGENKVWRSHPNARFINTTGDYTLGQYVFGGSSVFGDRIETRVINATNGQNNITVLSSAGMFVGKYFGLRVTNSFVPDVIYGASQAGGGVATAEYTGQMFKIVSIAGNVLTMDRPVYWTNYPVNQGMRGYYFNNIVEYSGIEGGVHASFNSNNLSMVFMFGAANCWVTQAEMTNTFEATISGFGAYATTVRSNKLAWHQSYTASSRYAYAFGTLCTDNLLEDNILFGHNLCVSLTQGAAGNVIGYNYAEYGWGFGFPTDNAPKCFMNTHGDGAMYNLFEGNVVPVIEIDDFWGANNRTMIYRNWCRRQSLYDASGTNFSLQNIAGIEIDSTNYNMTAMFNNIGIARDVGDPDPGITICYSHRLEKAVPDPNVTNSFINHQNFSWHNGSTSFSNTLNTVGCPSFYLTNGKPNFFGIYPYPMIGPDVLTYGITNRAGNPAMARALGENYSVVPNEPRTLGAKFRNMRAR